MNYYNLYNINDELLGVVTSLHLRYYNPISKRILCCDEKDAQYVRLNDDQLYRIYWFKDEYPEMIGKYPDARLTLSDKQSYQAYMKKIGKLV